MKYKVGDTITLKTLEQREKEGLVTVEQAKRFLGVSYKIEKILSYDHDSFYKVEEKDGFDFPVFDVDIQDEHLEKITKED